MRNILVVLILWPAITFAEFDIKSNLILPKQMDSHVRLEFKNVSKDENYYQANTQIVNGERSQDKITVDYRFGLFDDLTLVLKVNKLTRKVKAK